MNLKNRNRFTRKSAYGYQRAKEVEGINSEFGISRHKQLYFKKINNKVLLFSTGNCIQYLIIIYNGREPVKLYIYLYVNHFATPETDIIIKSTIRQQQQQQQNIDKTNSE